MKVEKFLIELKNGEFVQFTQESDTDIHVGSFKQDYFYQAEKMEREFAEHMFNELMDENTSWDFYGDCLEPKAIRKIIVELI